jgi:plasmid stability protein
VATLHVRDVPVDLYEDLRARADRAGLSINAMVIRILEETAEREAQKSELVRRLEAIASRIKLPADAPKPEDLIREGRDERDARAEEWM